MAESLPSKLSFLIASQVSPEKGNDDCKPNIKPEDLGIEIAVISPPSLQSSSTILHNLLPEPLSGPAAILNKILSLVVAARSLSNCLEKSGSPPKSSTFCIRPFFSPTTLAISINSFAAA